MGFLRDLFKPVSRVLDKIVPNELKPALPYLAAFAPYLLGPGIMGSTMGMRALSNAGLNAIGQLAQEGNEGELNPLSLLLAAGQGAGTAEGAGSTLRGFKNRGTPQEIARGNVPGMSGGFKYDTSGLTGLEKAKNFSLEGLANLADKVGGARDTLQGVLDMDPTQANLEKLTAAGATPFTQASGDVIYGEAVRQKKDYEREEARRLVEEEMRQRGLDQSYIDSIIASMTAYGYTQEEIDAILELQGYEGLAKGGRVGYNIGGGIMNAPEADFISMSEVVENVGDDKMNEGIIQMADLDEGKQLLLSKKYIELLREYSDRGCGMIPMGSKERADDVPARVSKNEFVMTADAVRAAGGGSVNKGAQRMYNLMNNLEARA